MSDVGVFFKMCREKKVQYINKPQVTQKNTKKKNDESDYYNPFFVNTVKQVCTNDSQWMVNLSLEGLTVPLKLDIGSNVKHNADIVLQKVEKEVGIKTGKNTPD